MYLGLWSIVTRRYLIERASCEPEPPLLAFARENPEYILHLLCNISLGFIHFVNDVRKCSLSKLDWARVV